MTQAMEALAYANEIRLQRAQLKREIRAGTQSLVGVLKDPPEFLNTMRLEELLGCSYKVGPTKIGQMCRAAEVSPQRPIGMVSERQRLQLLLSFRERCPVAWGRQKVPA